MFGGNVPPPTPPDTGGGIRWYDHEQEGRERKRRKRIEDQNKFVIEFLKTATNIINNQ